MEWKNRLTDILKISYPIVQAPMLGVTTPEMVAEISNNGGLGSLPVGGLSPEKTSALIRKTKELTGQPFAVNLFTNGPAHVNMQQVTAMQAFLEDLCFRNDLSYRKEPVEAYKFYSYKEQIAIITDENIPIVSFTFGLPDDESILMLKEKRCLLIGTATSVKEARVLVEKEIDIITAQGIEAGGHRGTFLTDEPVPGIGLMTLIPQIAANTGRPILAAGGICDGKSIKAALILGAEGVQVGTVFIACDESAAIPSFKTALATASDTDPVLTRAFSGRWARGIKNKFITEIETSGLEIPDYPVQLNLVSSIRAAATERNDKEFIPLWSGQFPASSEKKPAASIFRRLIEETEAKQ